MLRVAADILDNWPAHADGVREVAAVEAAANGGVLLDEEPTIEFHDRIARICFQMERPAS